MVKRLKSMSALPGGGGGGCPPHGSPWVSFGLCFAVTPVQDDLALVLALDGADALAHLALHPVHPRSHLLELVLEAQDGLDACKVESELRRKPLDQAQPLEV